MKRFNGEDQVLFVKMLYALDCRFDATNANWGWWYNGTFLAIESWKAIERLEEVI